MSKRVKNCDRHIDKKLFKGLKELNLSRKQLLKEKAKRVIKDKYKTQMKSDLDYINKKATVDDLKQIIYWQEVSDVMKKIEGDY